MLTDAEVECQQRDGSGFMPEVAADLLALRRAVRWVQAMPCIDAITLARLARAIAALPVPKEASRG